MTSRGLFRIQLFYSFLKFVGSVMTISVYILSLHYSVQVSTYLSVDYILLTRVLCKWSLEKLLHSS